jgi:thymidylate synthase
MTEDCKKKSQIDHVAKLLKREPRKFPKVWIEAEGIKSIFDFRPEHFKMDEYNPHPEMFIPTPV